MSGGLDSRCVGRVYGADGAVHCNSINFTKQLKNTVAAQTVYYHLMRP